MLPFSSSLLEESLLLDDDSDDDDEDAGFVFFFLASESELLLSESELDDDACVTFLVPDGFAVVLLDEDSINCRLSTRPMGLERVVIPCFESSLESALAAEWKFFSLR